MNWWNVLGIAIGLAMDALAVSIAVGLTIGSVTPRHVFRVAFHFGLFQFAMPILGWWAGATVSSYVVAHGRWLAAGLLGMIGGRMLLDARSQAGRGTHTDPSRGWTLVALSLATSVDALVVGLGMALLRVSIWMPCVVIGVVAAGLSTAGITLASRAPRASRRVVLVLGGCILIAIAVRTAISCEP